ncbi:MAG: response regulator [Candidatus Omnitrophica bacterium]|nr:response regulator [Candidatus Omnitrophota bacterium]MBU4477642.1 response regulator [Candidatus Omnitrophota bacterium]MCG2703132.1 response regulator [Candidatus Omnitrophota bacterium]
MKQVIDILLAEDNPDDIEITKRALKNANVINRLYVARDGEEALNFLYNKGDGENKPKPDLILLDINMPKVNGIEAA